MKLSPWDEERSWAPFVWLFYLVFFFLGPFYSHANWKVWTITVLGAAVFVLFFIGLFRLVQPWKYVALAAIVALGVGFTPFNPGSSVFFIYAASSFAFLFPKPWQTISLLAGLLLLAAAESYAFHVPSSFLFTVYIISIPVCVANIFVAQRDRATARLRVANEEIEMLAKVAERERIARDLHDVLGHTLSVIILKSELAQKLIDRDPARAKAEIGDVEQTSREALAEVRSTIRGYRVSSIEMELSRAKAALQTAGVAVNAEAVPVALNPAQESVIALVMREAVTNVVRHAGAQNCQLRLASSDGHCLLEVQDDGRGGDDAEGNGIRGMRERVEALGGSLERDTRHGTKLTIRIPVSAMGGDAGR
jgi:two-component system sensor histidine kinase DesK